MRNGGGVPHGHARRAMADGDVADQVRTRPPAPVRSVRLHRRGTSHHGRGGPRGGLTAGAWPRSDIPENRFYGVMRRRRTACRRCKLRVRHFAGLVKRQFIELL